MIIFKKDNKIFKDKIVIDIIKKGNICVFPTDTIYGIICSIFYPESVEKIYKIKKRNKKKPFIILISNIDEIYKIFKIKITNKQKKIILKNKKKSITYVLDYKGKKFKYLDRGTDSLAFRVPNKKYLRDFLLQTGPIVAPSANPESALPAKNIKEAILYFGKDVSFYVDYHTLRGKASLVFKLSSSGIINRLR